MKSAIIGVVLFAVACGPSSRGQFMGGDDTSADSNNNNNSNSDGCSDAAKLIYVVDENNKLSQFDPATKSFHDLGSLSCPAMSGATPFSMAVDRNAIAWVLFSSGELFRVDTMSLACTKTTWHSTASLAEFGMGFSTDAAGGTTDTLYIAGGTAPDSGSTQLATVSTSSFTSSPVGTIQGWPELTGNGNGELWGFFPDVAMPRVEKINKTTGAPAQTPFNESSLAGMPSAWAFGFWGGDYWIFLMKDLEFSTTVYQIDGTTGAVKGMTPTLTRTIVGAGVSTCAPTVIF
jgi:hypothetical protein